MDHHQQTMIANKNGIHPQQQHQMVDLSAKQTAEWKETTDPLQMLAKQCDTISGDEDKHKQSHKTKNGTGGGGATQNGANGGQHKGVGGGGGGTKAKSPNKHHLDPSCLPSPSSIGGFHPPFPNAFFPPPHPAQLAAALMNNPFLPMMPHPQQQRPPIHGTHQMIHQQMGPPFMPPQHVPTSFGPSAAAPPPPPFIAAPSAAQINMMQQLMAALQQQQQMPPPPPHSHPALIPGMFPPPNPATSTGIPLPPSMPMALRKSSEHQQQQQNGHNEMEAAAMMAMGMGMFQQAAVGPSMPIQQNGAPFGGAQPMDANGQHQQLQHLFQQPLQTLLMAAACGQLPQIPCFSKMTGGAVCGRVFPTDEQFFAHFKSAHIAQMTSPSAVSSTTAEGNVSGIPSQTTQTPTTTATGGGGGGKMRATGGQNNKNSPSSSRSTPTGSTQQQSGKGGGEHQQQQQTLSQQKSHSNPGPFGFNGGWSAQMMAQMGIGPPAQMGQSPQTFFANGGAGPNASSGNQRFHPYMMPNGGGGHQNGQQKVAIANHAPLPPPNQMQNLQQMAMALMAAGGLGLGPPPNTMVGPPPELSQQHQSQSLAALAAMANSFPQSSAANNQTTTGPTAPVGAAGSG